MTTFLSVGIDVGTTSTHLSFSRLTVVNAALVNQSPLPKFESREIVFQSPVHLTPLTSDGAIDAQSVFKLIEAEYERAKINRDDIKVGAAIVTGETALKRNAREVVEQLCLLSGDLVAVSAGPHLEAVLSARGSGAVAASTQNRSTILNIDIGGGTMNLALYKNGALISTHCLGIGGRCFQFKPGQVANSKEFEVNATNESGLFYLPEGFKIGDKLNGEELQKIANQIASDVVDFINQKKEVTKLRKLPLTSIEDTWSKPDEIWLCGGVAEFLLDEKLNRFQFSDLGGLFADALLLNLKTAKLNFKIPNQPIRATVTGAGMYSMQVSGSTIDFDVEHLPLRNIPLLRPFEDKSQLSNVDQIVSRIRSATERLDPELRFNTIAFELPILEKSLDYNSLKRIAYGLALAAKENAHLRPFVLVLQEDLGMALGQQFRLSLDELQKQAVDQSTDQNSHDAKNAPDTCPLIVLDGITTIDGDFIDIGKPVSLDANGIARTVPVVLKTLVFGNPEQL